MDVRDLVYFEAIVRLGNLGRAAEELGRTKPALSKCIRRLEEQAGASLFERSGRRLVLTAPGQTLLTHARQMRTAMADALRHVADEASGQRGHIRLGLGTSIVETLLPALSRWFAGEPEGITLDIRTGLNDALRRELIDDQLDGIVTTALADDGLFLAREDWVADEMVVVARAGHALARNGTVDMAEMADFNWVLTGRNVASRQWLDSVFVGRGLPRPRVRVEIGSTHLLSAFVESTDLLGFVPRRELDRRRFGASLQELRNEATVMRRTMSFLYRRNGYRAPALLRLAGALRAAIDGGAGSSAGPGREDAAS